MGQERFPPLLPGIRRWLDRIFLTPLTLRDRHVSDASRQPRLPGSGLRCSAKASPNQQPPTDNSQDYDQKNCQKKSLQDFHARSLSKLYSIARLSLKIRLLM